MIDDFCKFFSDYADFLRKVENLREIRGVFRIVEMFKDTLRESEAISAPKRLLQQMILAILNLLYPKEIVQLAAELNIPLLGFKTADEVVSYLDAVIRSGTSVDKKSGTVFLMGNTGVGKSSLANTFARYLRSPKDIPTPVLTQDNPDLLFTRVMQPYDGLSINKTRDLSVQVEELTPSVKLVKLESNLPVKMEESNLPVGKIQLIKTKLASLFSRGPVKEPLPEEPPPEEPQPEEFQMKIVDMGGHTATSLEAFRYHSVDF